MWITFKSCIFAFWNNFIFMIRTIISVVNYIQILYLCILKQRTLAQAVAVDRCELHSNLVSLHSETTSRCCIIIDIRLWITFKSCIFAFWNNISDLRFCACTVVNYIQILYLCILKQLVAVVDVSVSGCELHSNLVSLHSETTEQVISIDAELLWITFKSCIFAFWNNDLGTHKGNVMLWITFKSCIFAFWNNHVAKEQLADLVVNYIQILYLCILKQLGQGYSVNTDCCELHSNLVSLHSETTFGSGYSIFGGCELHSNLVSLHSETTYYFWLSLNRALWITFKSCIFAFWNNQSCSVTTLVALWITFKSCIFAFWNNLNKIRYSHHLLWITFKSCIFAFWNNCKQYEE